MPSKERKRHEREQKVHKPYYQALVQDILKIPDRFFEEHMDLISSRVSEFHGPKSIYEYTFFLKGDEYENHAVFDVNQLLHLSKALLAFGSNISKISDIKIIKDRFPGFEYSPATIYETATFAYILDYVEQHGEEWLKGKTQQIRSRMEETKWMVGPNAMEALGIPIQP